MSLEEKMSQVKVDSAKPAKKKAAKGGASQNLVLVERPEFIDRRIEIFEKLKKIQDEEIASRPRVPIKITLADGSVRDGVSYETTPMDIAKSISVSLAKRLVIAKVNGELWDTLRAFEQDSTLELLDFESNEGKKVYWHSSAHVLGEAAELRFGCSLCIGPPIEEGFYYEFGLPETHEGGVSEADYAPLVSLAQKAIKEKQPFERLIVTKEQLLDMFAYNKYKVQLISSKIPDGEKTTVYRCGPLIDLCRGPHVPDTGRIGSFMITKNSASYFLGDAANDSLQRMYGISFPDKKQMAEYLKFLEEAKRRDHRKIGREQELFYFSELSPGSAFFLPHGTRIYNALVGYIRELYWEHGFQEVMSPNMFNSKLWEQSGHWQNYRDDMFLLDVDKEQFALKPMNCPGHCLLFDMRERSYRELPLRFADFGVLHRNEASGALTGLTRVRRFQQDDAHIFCAPNQVESEILGQLQFLRKVYDVFGFTFELVLSTRPENYVGEIAIWDDAERQLASAMDTFGSKWEFNPGDGAFYGPKIDITIRDALNRRHQCATIQLDFQLPIRFNLQYRAPADAAAESDPAISSSLLRPVIVHRAILGSVERMIAILIENFAGKWPFWLSPRQIMVVPISPNFNDYAELVRSSLHAASFYVEVDLSGLTLNKKIRNAQLAQYNLICVVGAQEQAERSVNVRSRDDADSARGSTITLDDFIEKAKQLRDSKQISNSFN
ncbi:Threonine-tRNA ligase, cytoplasmic [Zancudomyces culisetae]|uniref:Threonine--tRNA ligase, cytoplasmic n=1 Tax=Zancudomyces culisetae TaxID=1213189 RepID=A0A1R1PGT5_ZANCU|nr:Threonine-tRNA ligase, cytoplasmic [Zancudomyces culisetae]OMH82582.1 Threonine-tRNA ligase, cytoplasmic [Zancudomyces culisetae]|eukprot:OMH80123.1 Threonine-tRNA ligase, cytoplasmic [Zancudomyces culisetae]